MAVKTKSSGRRRAQRLPKGENGGIELLLIHSVDHLGKQGDVVEVKTGYAMNYLIPQGLAMVPSDPHKRMVDKHRVKLEAIEKERLSDLRKLSDNIAKQSVTIEANANDEGHLYGSVGQPEIAAGLKSLGFAVTADQIQLEGALKELGLYNVGVRLHPSVECQMKVWVVPAVDQDKA